MDRSPGKSTAEGGYIKATGLNKNDLYVHELLKKNNIKRTVHIGKRASLTSLFNLLKLAGYVMHQQFNIQQLYVLPTMYLCVLYLSEKTQRLVQLTA